MPRAAGQQVQNNFTKGLITEATGLNFPEEAATDANNVVFSRIGLVSRRLGFDLETSASYRTITRTNLAISKYLWKNVTGDGSTSFVVTQFGSTLYFWDASDPDTAFPLSDSQIVDTIDLNDHLPAGSSNTISDAECQYASGYGYLFVTHPYLDPFYVSYDSGTFTDTSIDIKIRDFSGVDDSLAEGERPTALTTAHIYNLRNQGWTGGNSSFALSSTSSVAIGTGSKTWTVSASYSATTGFQVGDYVKVANTSVNFVKGFITAYSGTTLTVYVDHIGGSGTVATWSVYPEPSTIYWWYYGSGLSGFGAGYATGFNNYPSNRDVWWLYKDEDGEFDPQTTLPKIDAPVRAAPKGHFILSAFDEDRSAVSFMSGISAVTTNDIRPSACTFMSGRVFYTGLHYKGYENKVYFSQIIENNDVNFFGKCHQVNDPTSENFFDLLPSDGGVITVQEADLIYKIVPFQESLLVFARNGVYAITGSQGLGFSAIDYSIIKLDHIPSISHTSFVDVAGTPMWWNTEGIYTVSLGDSKRQGQSGPVIQSLTIGSIQSFFDSIPGVSKKFARGAYNRSSFIVQWLYRSTAATSTTETYEYDSVLCLNTVTGAFYTYTISADTDLPAIHDIVVVENPGGITTSDIVIDPTFKYLTSYTSGGNRVTWSEELDDDHLDWTTTNSPGTSYDSYFISGYHLGGKSINKFAPLYLNIYSKSDVDSAYKFRSLWDHATSASTGRWTTVQITDIDSDENLTVNETGYSTVPRRLKIRGHGRACQFMFMNYGDEPFYIIGWSALETGNQWI